MSDRRDSLPVRPLHVLDETDLFRRLRVDGPAHAVGNFSPSDLQRFPSRELTDDFACLDVWTVAQLHWRAVSVADLLQRWGLQEAFWLPGLVRRLQPIGTPPPSRCSASARPRALPPQR